MSDIVTSENEDKSLNPPKQGGRIGAAYATTNDPNAPLRERIQHDPTSHTSSPSSVEREAGGGRVRVSLDEDGCTSVGASSTVGNCAAMSRDNGILAGAVGSKVETKTNPLIGKSTSSAWGDTTARAVVLGEGNMKGTASVAIATGGSAKATGTKAVAMSWGPGETPGMVGPAGSDWNNFMGPLHGPSMASIWGPGDNPWMVNPGSGDRNNFCGPPQDASTANSAGQVTECGSHDPQSMVAGILRWFTSMVQRRPSQQPDNTSRDQLAADAVNKKD